MDDIYQTIKNLGPARLGVMGAVGMGILGFFIYLMAEMTGTNYAVLYQDLSAKDAAAVTGELDLSGTNYRIQETDGAILVPVEKVAKLRMVLAEKGLPANGSIGGYELFDEKQSFGTTQFVQNITKVRALEGELARTISSLEGIRQARLHIVLPKRELFSREEQPASASVLLQLQSANSIRQEQVAAIQHIIATAVPKLEPSRISITDDRGNLLARGIDSKSESFASMQANEQTRNYEQRLTTSIVEILSRTVGYENVMATVSAELDFDKVTTQTTSFDPEQQIPISTVLSESSRESVDAASNQAVSVANNLPGGGGAATGGGSDSSSDRENNLTETTNFEIGRTITSAERAPGRVKRLSVAVVVNGTYTTDEEGNRTYNPRSEQSMSEIEAIVKSAVGFDEARGDLIRVTNMEFAGDTTVFDEIEDSLIFGFERAELLRTAETAVMAIVAGLILLLVVKPLITRIMNDAAAARKAQAEADKMLSDEAEALAALPPAEAIAAIVEDEDEEKEMERMIDIHQVEGKVKESSLRKVGEIVENHPTEAVSILRNWMYQES